MAITDSAVRDDPAEDAAVRIALLEAAVERLRSEIEAYRRAFEIIRVAGKIIAMGVSPLCEQGGPPSGSSRGKDEKPLNIADEGPLGQPLWYPVSSTGG